MSKFAHFVFHQTKTWIFTFSNSVTSKKLPNVYKSCPKMKSLEKLKILTSLQTLPKNVGDLGKLIVAKALKNCPKSNKLPNLVTQFSKYIKLKRINEANI